MPKAVEAFRTISEVADDLGIPKHVLRFWEVKFSQIRPMKRGGGRRYYRPEDMELLRGIRYLLHREGYTIKGVQKILKEQGVDQVKVHGLDTTGNEPGQVAAMPVAGMPAAPMPVAPPPLSPARPRAGGTARAARATSASIQRDQIRKAIEELEACRALLGAKPRDMQRQARTTPRRTAAGS